MKTKMNLHGKFKNGSVLPFVLTVPILSSSNNNSYLPTDKLYKYYLIYLMFNCKSDR